MNPGDPTADRPTAADRGGDNASEDAPDSASGQGGSDPDDGFGGWQPPVFGAGGIDRSRFVTPSVVLSRWRVDVAGLTQQAAAARTHLSRPHLANMESGARKVPRGSWKALDVGYDAGGALEGLLAASLVTDLPPRHLWSHNYDHAPSRVWMWLRPAAPDTPASITWGPLKLSITALPHPEGLIVTSPTSWPNPPAEVHFDPTKGPGWAGFGCGVVPTEFGVELVDGADKLPNSPLEFDSLLARVRSVLTGRYWSQVREMASYFQIREGIIPHLATLAPVGERPVTVSGAHTTLPVSGTGEVRLIPASELKQLREAGGWTQSELAVHASKLEQAPSVVNEDGVRGAESGRASNHPYLLAMLDKSIGLDGRSCLSPVGTHTPDNGTIEVNFPKFWTGPVYLQFLSRIPERGQRRMTLTWGPWRRRLDVSSGAIVTTRRASLNSPTLVVSLPPGWTVLTGLGWPPGAHDVGEGWRPAGPSGMKDLVLEAVSAFRAQRDQEETASLPASTDSGGKH